MNRTTDAPKFLGPVLGQVDEALEFLTTHRMSHFLEADEKYSQRRKAKYLGFERLVTCELYCRLKELFRDAVFAEFPGTEKERIDLWLNFCDCNVYIELKMFYSDTRQPYEKDFNKLKRMVDKDTGAFAIQVHFQFYPNRNHAAAKTLERLATTLPPAKYWRNISCISGKMDRYFVRLAFGRK